MLTQSAEIRVRYAETDQMGFAHHGNYLAWLEVARIRLLEAVGCPYPEVEARGYRIPVIEAQCRYRQPAYFDDVVRIEATMKEMPGVRFHLDYELHSGERHLATARTGHAFIDANGRPTRPPEFYLEALRGHFA